MRTFLLILVLSPLFGLAQIVSSVNSEVPLLTFDKPHDIEQLILEDDTKDGTYFRFAKMVYCDLSPKNSGVWTEVEGGKVWSLAISATDAKAISLYYDNFWIPSQGRLYIYNTDKSQKIGPFTSQHNHESGVFATELIYGDILVLEYFQPHSETADLELHINRFAYAYKDVSGGQLSGYDSSDDCEVNANCEEGNAWENQKKSVCRIQIADGFFSGLCSGALVNNTLNDCTPYVLSADHCFDGGDISSNNLNQSIFYFNYRSSACNNSVPNNTYSITGCQKLSNSGGEGDNGDSDFFLVELNSEPDFDPYFAGWDRTNSAASSGVSIHHPSGDIMKISTFTNSLYTTGGLGFGNDNTTHWGVVWSQTTNGHGVTEGGSSGSSIFNQNGLVTGVLTGGASYCDATNQSDVYGKVWHAWDQMGNTNDKQLKPWLDPVNANITTLNGIYCNQSAQVISAFTSSERVVCKNSTVTFTSISTGSINSYEWTFNGGEPSSASGPGPHTVSYNFTGDFDVSLVVDGDENSDTYTQTDYISVAPNVVELDFLPDCYGEEISWFLENENGQQLYAVSSGYYPGGSSSSDLEANPVAVIENWCLPNGCYEFTVEDEYGDGLYGSQHSCEFDGDFTIYDGSGAVLADLTALNSDFGDDITLDFCVDSPLGINEQTIAFDIFPNPTTGIFSLVGEQRGEVKIFNTILQEVYSSLKNSEQLHIDLSQLEKGLYFIHFEKSVRKLILN
jgi:PKD repeat protein